MTMPYNKNIDIAKFIAGQDGRSTTPVAMRIYSRYNGIAAVEPTIQMLNHVYPKLEVEAMTDGDDFKADDTVMVLRGPFNQVVAAYPLASAWINTASIAATEMHKLKEINPAEHIIIEDTITMAPHPVMAALQAYGSWVVGCNEFSSDYSANYDCIIEQELNNLCFMENAKNAEMGLKVPGIGFVSSHLLSLYRGDYVDVARAWKKAYPNPKASLDVMISYNNRELSDLKLLIHCLGDQLGSVIVDPPRNNTIESVKEKGLSHQGIHAIHKVLKEHEMEKKTHITLIAEDDVNKKRIQQLNHQCKGLIMVYYARNLMGNMPRMDAMIFEVDGVLECQDGLGYIFDKNEEFYSRGPKITEKVIDHGVDDDDVPPDDDEEVPPWADDGCPIPICP